MSTNYSQLLPGLTSVGPPSHWVVSAIYRRGDPLEQRFETIGICEDEGRALALVNEVIELSMFTASWKYLTLRYFNEAGRILERTVRPTNPHFRTDGREVVHVLLERVPICR